MKQETDRERARKAGRAAAHKQSISIAKKPIETPLYDAIYSKRFAEVLAQAFWDGVEEWREEQRNSAMFTKP